MSSPKAQSVLPVIAEAPAQLFRWFGYAYALIATTLWLLVALVSADLFGESVGGPLWVTNPCRARWDAEGGVIFPQLSPFDYGVLQSTPSEIYIEDRPTQASYYVGLRGSYGIPCSRCDDPIEIYGRAGFYKAHYRNFYDTDSADPHVLEPRLDGLTSGTGPKSLLTAHSVLGRTLLSGEAEAGIRQRFCCRCWSFYPGLFVSYQRSQQLDTLKTDSASVEGQPADAAYYMRMRAHTNSDHYGGGINAHFSRPILCGAVCLCGSAMVGGEWIRSLYNGNQTFTLTNGSPAYDVYLEVKDKGNRIGFMTGGELGLRLFLVRTLSVSFLANVRYTNAFPFVNYSNVNKELNRAMPYVDFHKQLTYGAVVNLSIAFKQGRLKIL